MQKLPPLADVHVHLREPGATHKEDFDTGTQAALAGGITTVLAMPNTQPPLVDAPAFKTALDAAAEKARCDYGVYLGAGLNNAPDLIPLAPRAAGLKLYLDATFGELLLDDTQAWMAHFAHWPKNVGPIVAHAERQTLAALLFVAALHKRHVHIAHVSRKEEILMIRAAKEKGYPVTCEVGPHHLFLCEDDFDWLPLGRREVRPRLATKADQQALWDNLDVVDCFATDHAPHLLSEKDSENPPPGFPGVETMLPLLLNAVHEGRLTLDDLITRLHANPKRIFNLPDQPGTWVEVDPDAETEIRAADMFSRCGWTPYEGWRVRGRVTRVVLRETEVYKNGVITAHRGFGRNIRSEKLAIGS